MMNVLKLPLIIRYGNFLSKQISEEQQQAILSMLDENRKAVMADLGCLDGRRTISFIKKISPSRVYGLDMLGSALKVAKKKLGIIPKKVDLNKKFPLDNKSCDVVTTTHLIEHLTDTDNFLSEIYRILKPGGYVVIATDNLAGWFNILSLAIGNQPTAGPTVSTKYLVTFNPLWWEEGSGGVRDIKWPMHHNVMTTKTLVRLLERYGFKIEEVHGSGYPPVPYPLAKVFTYLDLYHSMFVVVKARRV